MLLKRKARSAWHVIVVAVAVLFAAMPVVSSALATSAGAFSRVFLHIHAVEHPDHVHDEVHEHAHEHHADDHHHHDGSPGDEHFEGSADLIHVHHDAGYPSVLMPVAVFPQVTHRLSARLRVPGSHEPPGELRGRLLRPPIALF